MGHVLLSAVHRVMRRRKEYEEWKMSHAQPFLSRRIRARNRIRDRARGLQIIAELSDWEFQKMFRMDRAAFKRLVNLLAIDLLFNASQAKRSSGSAISIVIRVAAALRWLAGGSHLDICAMFGLDLANFFHPDYVLWVTIDAINRRLQLGLSLKPEDLKRTADGFSRYTDGYMYGCVSAIDGWVIQTHCPTKKEVKGKGQISDYRNRKGFWGMLVLAGTTHVKSSCICNC